MIEIVFILSFCLFFAFFCKDLRNSTFLSFEMITVMLANEKQFGRYLIYCLLLVLFFKSPLFLMSPSDFCL